MSAERWLRSGGLWLPRGFATAPWMFGASFGCACFAPEYCEDWYLGSLPDDLWVDVPALANGSCSTCADAAGTYQVTRFDPINYPCQWIYTIISGFCPPAVAGMRLELVHVPAGPSAYFDFQLYPSPVSQAIIWQVALSAPISSIAHTLTYDSYTGPLICDGAGTIVDIYE